MNFYDANKQEIVTHHLESIELIRVNSKTLFLAVDSLMDRMEIPYTYLVSVLLDSCAVMRGHKSGLES